MSAPATTALLTQPCKAQERYKAFADERHDMRCCKAHGVPYGMGHAVHAGPCCADPACGDCDPVLVMARVTSERKALAEALALMVESYELLTAPGSHGEVELPEHSKGVARAYFFGAIHAAHHAIDLAGGR